MLLAGLYNHLLLNNAANFEKVLGITVLEYAALLRQFNATSDKTRSLPEAEKLISLILVKRFDLSDENIKSTILPGKSKSVLDNFKSKIMPRLDSALVNLPLIAEKLKPEHAPLSRSCILNVSYADLDDLLLAIEMASQQDVITTAKSRVMDDKWKDDYLLKSVTSKKKTGQDNFLQALHALMYDMEKFESKEPYHIIYMASVLNLNAHNSSYAPIVGYGKAQQREIDHPNKYSRSQGKHIYSMFYKQLTAVDRSNQCLLPKNEVVFKLLENNVKNSFVTNLSKYNEYGYLKPGVEPKKLSYFSLEYAHSGLRSNAYTVAIKGISYYLTSHTPKSVFSLIRKEFSLEGSQRKSILKLSPSAVKSQLIYANKVLNQLREKMAGRPYHDNLYLSLTRFRRQNAQAIVASVATLRLENIGINYDSETNCLDIQCYPGKDIENNANYTEGVTNVIINFFIGLLNHKLERAGLFIHAQRRQSFAFNRITVTDTTNLCMRVSLGYEPSSFVPIFVEALQVLSNLLDKTCYNFLDRKNVYLQSGFKVVEALRSAEANEKSGTKFLNYARSETRMLDSIVKAEEYLRLSCGAVNYESRSFLNYIYHVTDEENKITHPVNLTASNPLSRDVVSAPNNLLVIGLLNNLLKFTLDKIEKTVFIADHAEYLYSYKQLISKLTKSCVKASSWLDEHVNYYSSHVYAKVLLLVDDMLENLILLDSLRVACQKDGVDHQVVLRKLAAVEEAYAEHTFGIAKDRIDVFYSDNGQQALTVSALCMSMQVATAVSALNAKVYAFGKCYYELFSNLKDNLGISLCASVGSAQFVYVDIREINEFKRRAKELVSAKVVILDSTHNPCFSDGDLKSVVNELLKKNIWVIIVGSMLKHEQLGLDKFQAGKLLVLSPVNQRLNANVRDELSSITIAAMHPVTASFFLMINDICRDKLIGQELKEVKIGLFNKKEVDSKSQSSSSPGQKIAPGPST